MIRIACTTVAVIGSLLLASGSPAPDAEFEGIKKTALDYAQGWYDGNAERMERALHPDLAKRVLMPDPKSGRGRIEHMGALRLVQATRSGAGTRVPTDRRRTDVTVLDVYGRAASVKLEMHDWIDYLHLSKLGDRWVIVNVLWELTPQAKKRRGIAEGG